jgi:hypothetical protein
MRAKGLPELKTDIERIEDASERASGLVRQLLAFSRRQVLQPKVLDLNAIVLGLDKLLRRLMDGDIEMLTVADQPVGAIKADPGQIEQVIMNLVVNARDAMPDGGRLVVETANVELGATYARDHATVRAGRYVLLAVSDTGLGMSVETVGHIFEPFYTTKENGRGTGLGLSTVYGIVKQSGGYVWVYSEPGRGTTFKVYLPRVDEAVEVLPGGTLTVENRVRMGRRRAGFAGTYAHGAGGEGINRCGGAKRGRRGAFGGEPGNEHSFVAYRCDHARPERARIGEADPGSAPVDAGPVYVGLYV